MRSCDAAQICPAPFAPAGVGNATCVQEGFSSIIERDGGQAWMPLFVRTDGQADAAMGLALAATLVPGAEAPASERARWGREAAQLMDTVYRWSDAQVYRGSTPADPAFGIVTWNQKDAGDASGGIAAYSSSDYGSNAACILLGGTVAAAALGTGSWRERMLLHLFAEARTTGRRGVRPSAVSTAQLRANGWQAYFNDTTRGTGGGSVHGHLGPLDEGQGATPHYLAQPIAYFLFAGHATGMHALFTAPAKAWLGDMMESLERGGWYVCQSMTNELSLMTTALAWLVRVEDTPRHRAWLERAAGPLLAYQTKSGGIKQFWGAGNESGKFGTAPPRSNAQFGGGESTLMMDGSEPVTDALYSLNFAAIGLLEAAGATGDPRYAKAGKALSDYLVRIQAESDERPELAGAWYRAFDYEKWEYWAMDSDWAYGPWVTDNGWTNGNIMAAMAAAEAGTTLWDLMEAEGREWDMAWVSALCRRMLEGRADEFCAGP
jgi:hypothetical protein